MIDANFHYNPLQNSFYDLIEFANLFILRQDVDPLRIYGDKVLKRFPLKDMVYFLDETNYVI